jgi:hypothetical protein
MCIEVCAVMLYRTEAAKVQCANMSDSYSSFIIMLLLLVAVLVFYGILGFLNILIY